MAQFLLRGCLFFGAFLLVCGSVCGMCVARCVACVWPGVWHDCRSCVARNHASAAILQTVAFLQGPSSALHTAPSHIEWLAQAPGCQLPRLRGRCAVFVPPWIPLA